LVHDPRVAWSAKKRRVSPPVPALWSGGAEPAREPFPVGPIRYLLPSEDGLSDLDLHPGTVIVQVLQPASPVRHTEWDEHSAVIRGTRGSRFLLPLVVTTSDHPGMHRGERHVVAQALRDAADLIDLGTRGHR